MEIDTQGTFNMCHACFHELKKSGRGLILNISATLHYTATWYQSHVSAAKAAIDSLTRSFALEWGDYKIRVNGIAPGPIADTAGFSKLGGEMAGLDHQWIAPLGRAGTKLEIALAAVYLACDVTGSYISGHTLIVDGGNWLMKRQLAPRDAIREYSRQIEKPSRDADVGRTRSKL